MIAEIEHRIVGYGLTAEDLGFDTRDAVASEKTGRKVLVCYRDNNGNTWTGRGKHPDWLVKEPSLGRKMEDFLIA